VDAEGLPAGALVVRRADRIMLVGAADYTCTVAADAGQDWSMLVGIVVRYLKVVLIRVHS